jgi:mono/diheme cytochrome c family protein
MRIVFNLMWVCSAALALGTIATIAEPTAGAAPALASSSAARFDDGDRINGRKVFLRENCYICHGGRAGGGMCPSLREDPPDESDVRHAVEDGTESGMPSYEGRVSRDEMEDLAAYFESLRSAREPIFTHWWEPGVPSR